MRLQITAKLSLMKGSGWVLEALCNFQEFVAAKEYFFAAPWDKHIEDITWPRGDMKFLFEC